MDSTVTITNRTSTAAPTKFGKFFAHVIQNQRCWAAVDNQKMHSFEIVHALLTGKCSFQRLLYCLCQTFNINVTYRKKFLVRVIIKTRNKILVLFTLNLSVFDSAQFPIYHRINLVFLQTQRSLTRCLFVNLCKFKCSLYF